VKGQITLSVMMALLALLLIPTKAQGDDKVSKLLCPTEYAALTLPTPLVKQEKFRLSGKLFDMQKLKKATTIIDVRIGSAAKLPKLDEKTYLYVIDKNQNLALIERFLDPGADVKITNRTKFLGSHEGLKRLLQTKSSEQVELISAGEIVIRNGRVFSVSNGAGTYKGTTVHLDYGIEKLKQAGLAINDRTEVRDFSKSVFADPHDFDGKGTIEALRALRDPKFASVLQETRRVMKSIDGKFPDDEEFFASAIKTTDDDAVKRDIYEASRLLRYWQNASYAEAWAVYQCYSRSGDEQARRALRILETYPSLPRDP
jgi:hypothetical protein